MLDIKMFFNDPNMPDESMLELLHSAFRERIDQGINFGCATYSMEEYRKETRNAYLFVAYDEERPVGSITLKIQNKLGFIYGSQKYVATVNHNKRSGIGTLLQNTIVEFAKENKCCFIVSATALNAESSVKWHIKNGFVPSYYKQFQDRNYSSVVFIYPISILFKFFFLICRYPVLYASKLLVVHRKR